MKANEFVKKFGFKSAKYWIDHFNNVNTLPDEFINIEFLNNLKRLVESHDLVEKHGSLSDAKTELKRLSILRWIDPKTERLRAAIADVESCMEGVS